MENKKAQVTSQIFVMIILAFFFMIILGAFMYIFGIVDGALAGDINAGSVNLSNASAQTVGQINLGLLNSADLIGTMFIGGLILMVMLMGYMTREKTIKIFFFLEFFVVILSYIIAVYISNEWESLLTILPFSDLLIANAPVASGLMLFLPRIAVAVGFVTIILAYGGIPRTREEEVVGF